MTVQVSSNTNVKWYKNVPLLFKIFQNNHSFPLLKCIINEPLMSVPSALKKKVTISDNLSAFGNLKGTGSSTMRSVLQNSWPKLKSVDAYTAKKMAYSPIHCQWPVSRNHKLGPTADVLKWFWGVGTRYNSAWIVKRWYLEQLCPTSGQTLGLPTLQVTSVLPSADCKITCKDTNCVIFLLLQCKMWMKLRNRHLVISISVSTGMWFDLLVCAWEHFSCWTCVCLMTVCDLLSLSPRCEKCVCE